MTFGYDMRTHVSHKLHQTTATKSHILPN